MDEEAKRDTRAELAVVLLIKDEFICSRPVKPSHNRRNLRATSTRIRIHFFFKSEIYLSILALRPHVIGLRIGDIEKRRADERIQRF